MSRTERRVRRRSLGRARLERRAERDLHVGRGKMQLARFGAKLMPPSTSTAVRVETPRATVASLTRKLVLFATVIASTRCPLRFLSQSFMKTSL